MKNHRDVCSATAAGYVEFKGLPGRVQSGCPNTPDYKSRYCLLHKPAVAIHTSTDGGLAQSQKDSTSKDSQEDQVGLIIGKRTTRQSVLYEVVWLGRPVTESS